MTLFRKNKSKSELHQEYQCTVRFLDDSEPIQVSFTKDTLGQFVLDKVCDTLNLIEKDYFGLRYVDNEKQRHWLDPTKTIYKQLKGVSPCVLCFRVKFYPADPMKLREEITRYYLFLQLRRDLHHGRLLCSPQDANLLAAYIIQSEVGDYDPQDHPPGYVAEFKMLPKQNIKMEEQIQDVHKTLTGQVPAEAEGNFLKKASSLDTYGVDPHQVKDQKGTPLYLGVTHQGIMTFHGSRRTQLYKWSQIKKLAFEGKMFIAHVNINEDLDQPNPKKKHQPIGFKCTTIAACKYLWKCAVEQQFFFTLSTSLHVPKMRSGGSLFSRGSKFRFSGRCQNEAYQASEDIKRKEPDFQRSSSLPNFARKSPDSRFHHARNHAHSPGSPTEESPIDVPGHQMAELPASPTVKAPVKEGEPVVEEIQQVQSADLHASYPGSKQNGGIPIIVTPANDSTFDDSYNVSYDPEDSVFGQEDDAKAAKSLEDQIVELEREYERKAEEQNHISAAVVQETEAPKAVVTESQREDKVAPPKKGGCSCARVLATTFFSVFFALTIAACVVMFSDIQHPVMDELRTHLHFLNPARDFILDKYNSVFQKS